MRGFKLTTAIVTIIESIFITIGGIGVIMIGVLGAGFFGDVFASVGLEDALGMIGSIMAIVVIVGVIILALGILFLVLGIKFCSHKPNKGIAITLLVFNILGAFSVFTYAFSGIVSIVMVVFLIIYLVLLGKQGGNQNNNYNNYNDNYNDNDSYNNNNDNYNKRNNNY